MTEEGNKSCRELTGIIQCYDKYGDDAYFKLLLKTWVTKVPAKDAVELLDVARDLLKTEYTGCGEDTETVIIDALGEKLKLGRMVNKLPELEGIFEKRCKSFLQENKDNDKDDSVITFVFNIAQDDPDRIRFSLPNLTNRESVYSPMYNIIATVTNNNSSEGMVTDWDFQTSIDYLQDKVIVHITNFIENNLKHPLFKEMSLVEQQDYLADTFKRSFRIQGRNYIQDNAAFDKFKQSIEVQIYSKFRNLIKKLPETTGLFENSIDNIEYTYVCTFKRVPENLKQTLRRVLVEVFESLIFRLKINFQQKSKYQISTINDNLVGKLTGLIIHPNSQRQIGGWIDKWVTEGIFEHWPYKQWPDSDNDKIIEELVADENFVSVWKTKYEDLTNTHPELKGIFESKSDKVIPYRLEVKVNIKNGEHLKPAKNALEKVKRLFELPVYGWPCNILKDEGGNLILTVILADALTLKGAQNHQQLVKRVATMHFEKEGLFEYFNEVEDIKYNIIETKFDKLKEKLPELKGIFESILVKDKRVLYVNFNPITDSAVAELLETILNKTSRYFNFWFDDQPSSVNKNGTCFTFVLDCSNIRKADTTEGGEAIFWNNYRTTQEEIYRNTKIPSEVRQEYGKSVHWNFEWASKYKKMVTKLPELEGIFESEYLNLFEKYLS